jgi:hypothetical protein
MTDVSDQPATTGDGEQIGWQVVDPDGNVIASGPVSEAQAAGLIAELMQGDE